MAEAAGRLFVDVTQLLASPASRAANLALLVRSAGRGALQTILERDGFLPSLADEGRRLLGAAPALIETDPAIVTELIAHEASSPP